MANNIGDDIFEAVQIIVDGTVSKLAFDKTITATIVDISNADKGEYVVDDGATSFSAYSDNPDYGLDTRVYVNIPNGDFTKQKMITGKYVTLESYEPYLYISPWNQFINITGNLFPQSGEVSILTNGLAKEQFIVRNQPIDLSGYEVLGVQGDFKTLLSSLQLLSGDYGLNIYLQTKDGQIHLITLSTEDMIGNPYEFNSYYNQQKVFDISNIDNVVAYSVSLFQDGDFKNVEDELIKTVEYKDGTQNVTLLTADNIFANNIQLALGYKTESIEDDTVLLYTLDTKTYKKEQDNQKTLKVRWIRKDDNGNLVTFEDLTKFIDTARLHWYKYQLGSDVKDDLAGPFWKEIEEWRNGFEQVVDFNNNLEEQNVKYKVLIETPLREVLTRDAKQDPEVHKAAEKLDEAMLAYNTATEADEAKKEEELKTAEINYQTVMAPYLLKSKLYESEPLVFENEEQVADLATLDLIQALQIDIDSKGIFSLYGQNNEILNSGDASKKRTMTATYESLITGEKGLDTAESIAWRFPLQGTMIQAPAEGIEFNSATDRVEYSEDGQYCTIIRDMEENSGSIGDSLKNNAEQLFRIKSYYQASAANNTISCYVIKNGKSYVANADLSFGPAGNSGTDYDFITTMQSGRTCLYGKDYTPLRIETKATDYEGVEQELEVTYSWYSQDVKQKVAFCDSNGEIIYADDNKLVLIDECVPAEGMNCYIRLLKPEEMKFDKDYEVVEDDLIPYYTILQAQSKITNSNGKTVVLTSYLPIPFSRNGESYNHIDGADKIVYDSFGAKPFYYKNQYVLYDRDNNIVEDVKWKTKNEASNLDELNFYPKVDKEGFLIPLSSFVDDIDREVAAVGYTELSDGLQRVLWTQPIVIYQDTYKSTLLNSWDGNYTVNEEDGTVLATMIGAGKKDKENRYSGVLLGDVAGTGADSAASMGLFGYHEGAQSFGFRTDGTAFLGKASRGRILFDGNQSVIQSSSYSNGSTGMFIDLDDGTITMRGSQITTLKEKRTVEEIQVANFKNVDKLTFLDSEGKEINNDSDLNEAVEILKAANKTPLSEIENIESIQNALQIIKQKASSIIYNTYTVQADDFGDLYITKKDEANNEIKEIIYEYDTNTGIYTKKITNIAYISEPKDVSSLIRLSAISPYFQITDDEGNAVIKISNKDYFLQSADYSTTNHKGTHFNLKNGKLNSYSFDLTAEATLDTILDTSIDNATQSVNVTTYSEVAIYKDFTYSEDKKEYSGTNATTRYSSLGNQGEYAIIYKDSNKFYVKIDNLPESALNDREATPTNIFNQIDGSSLTNGKLVDEKFYYFYADTPREVNRYRIHNQYQYTNVSDENDNDNEVIYSISDGTNFRVNLQNIDDTVIRIDNITKDAIIVYTGVQKIKDSVADTLSYVFIDTDSSIIYELEQYKETVPETKIEVTGINPNDGRYKQGKRYTYNSGTDSYDESSIEAMTINLLANSSADYLIQFYEQVINYNYSKISIENFEIAFENPKPIKGTDYYSVTEIRSGRSVVEPSIISISQNDLTYDIEKYEAKNVTEHVTIKKTSDFTTEDGTSYSNGKKTIRIDDSNESEDETDIVISITENPTSEDNAPITYQISEMQLSDKTATNNKSISVNTTVFRGPKSGEKGDLGTIRLNSLSNQRDLPFSLIRENQNENQGNKTTTVFSINWNGEIETKLATLGSFKINNGILYSGNGEPPKAEKLLSHNGIIMDSDNGLYLFNGLFSVNKELDSVMIGALTKEDKTISASIKFEKRGSAEFQSSVVAHGQIQGYKGAYFQGGSGVSVHNSYLYADKGILLVKDNSTKMTISPSGITASGLTITAGRFKGRIAWSYIDKPDWLQNNNGTISNLSSRISSLESSVKSIKGGNLSLPNKFRYYPTVVIRDKSGNVLKKIRFDMQGRYHDTPT